MQKLLIVIFILLNIKSFSQDDTLVLFVDKIPKNICSDIDLFTKYINNKNLTNYQKAKIYYTWIAKNINYDINSYNSNNSTFKSSNEVLKTRKAVCQGYSQLFKDLCEKSNIECEIINGYSKGYGYKQSTILQKPDHQWNAFYSDSSWHLIDVTWGSGYINKNGKFIKNLNLKYFDSFKEYFIQSHLPLIPSWQLLNYPISAKEFLMDSIDLKNSSNKVFYNYNDTIDKIKRYPENIRELKLAESAFRYNPQNTIYLGYRLLDFANSETIRIKEDNNLSSQEKYLLSQEILKIYYKSEALLKKSKDVTQLLKVCQNNIISTKKNIEYYKFGGK